MLQEIDIDLPDWINRYVLPEYNIHIEAELNDDNYFEYHLAQTCPKIFEKYAVLLHPAWVDKTVKDLALKGIKIFPGGAKHQGYQRLSWKEFFLINNRQFHFERCHKEMEELIDKISIKKWPDHFHTPEEGSCEMDEIISITAIAGQIYPAEEIYYFNSYLNIADGDSNVIYKGSAADSGNLLDMESILDSPSAIYPNSAGWCMVTDPDLTFTFVGGETKFIDKILVLPDYEIFEVKPTILADT